MSRVAAIAAKVVATIVTASAATWLIAGCSGAAAPRVAPPRLERDLSRTQSQHLLDRVSEVTVAGGLRGLDGDLDAPGASDLVCRFDAETAPAPPWFDGSWVIELERDRAAPRHATAELHEELAARFVTLAKAQEGLHQLLPAPPDTVYVVTARLRAPRDGRGGALWVVSHDFEAGTSETLAATLARIDLGALSGGVRATLDGGGDGTAPRAGDGQGEGDWRDVTLVIPPEPARRALSVSLLPTDLGLDCDFVEIRRAALPCAIGSRPRFPFDAGSHPLRRLVQLRRATSDVLLVPSGARVAFPVAIPRLRPRLLFSAGAFAIPAGAAVRVAVRVAGEIVHEASLAAVALDGDAPDAPVTIDLARFAGRSTTVEWSCESAADAVALFEAPSLLGAPAAPAERPPNVVVISLDTLRADQLGCYGDRRGLSPCMDGLAAGGLRFSTVWSPSSYTLPTHMSLMTGQHPLVHGVLGSNDALDPARSPMLAARLRSQGYFTAAFTGGGFVAPSFGFGAGFEHYGVDDPCGETHLKRDRPLRHSGSVADPRGPALAWLRAHADQPFFLFLHTFFVHNYAPAASYLERLADPGASVANDAPLALRELAKGGDASALARLRSLYAATVAEVDAELVARVLALLDELSLRSGTVVCIVADHGEEFLEHGGLGHAKELYSESTRVPWIVAGPGVPVGVVHDQPVELADVAPTLAALLGLPSEPRMLARDQMAAALRDRDRQEGRNQPGVEEQRDEPEGNELRQLQVLGRDPAWRKLALVAGRWKLLRWQRGEQPPLVQLFCIDDDAGEQHDRAADDPARRRGLEAQLDAQLGLLQALAGSLPSSRGLPAMELTEAQRAALRELGYLEE